MREVIEDACSWIIPVYIYYDMQCWELLPNEQVQQRGWEMNRPWRFHFFSYDPDLEVVWETGLKGLVFHGSLASVSALETLGQCWTPPTEHFCCAPSWQQGLHYEVTKQPVQKQEEIPCPRTWLQGHPEVKIQRDQKRELVKHLLFKKTNIYSDKDKSLPCSRACPLARIRREFPSRLFLALQLWYCNAVV